MPQDDSPVFEKLFILKITPKVAKSQKLKSERMKANKIFKMYEQATSLFKQGDFEEALSKYNQVISDGANIDDEMALKVVNAALRQREKCQFRVLKF